MSHDHKGHPGHTKSLKALRNLIKLPGDRDLVKKYFRVCRMKSCCCFVDNGNDESAMARTESYVEMSGNE